MFRPSQTDFGSIAMLTQPSQDPQWERELTVPLPLPSTPGSLVEGPCLWGARLAPRRGDSLVMPPGIEDSHSFLSSDHLQGPGTGSPQHSRADPTEVPLQGGAAF